MEEVMGPVVAGKFYPDEENELIETIEGCYTHRFGPGKVPEVSGEEEEFDGPAGLIAPHAGYRYSGPVAAQGYSWAAELGKPKTVVVIGTNHSGLGPAASLLAEGGWATPLGTVGFAAELGEKVLESSRFLESNRSAFAREHSIEVQLPFLQHLWGNDFSVLPICLKDQRKRVAEDLASALRQFLAPETLLVASTDFSHYEKQAVAERKDGRAIDAILDLNPDSFYEEVREHEISICGSGSIGVLLNIALNEGLKPVDLKYATSGDVAGYAKEVVGYSAIGFRG